MMPHYEGTPQTLNIPAAIAWHSGFPPDEIVPAGEVMFQKGKQIQESDFRWEDGVPWFEVNKLHYGFMEDIAINHLKQGSIEECADQSGAPQPATVLNGASHPTQNVQYTYYDRDSVPPGHMYQV
jgi:hypothetical protein